MNKRLTIFFVSIISCQEKSTITQNTTENLSSTSTTLIKRSDLDTQKTVQYHQFKADTLANLTIADFEVLASYQLKNVKVIEGNYRPIDGKIVVPDTEKDQGRRLLILNNKNKIISKSKGVGEVYLNKPYFYKNDVTDDIIIVCQLGYEFFLERRLNCSERTI